MHIAPSQCLSHVSCCVWVGLSKRHWTRIRAVLQVWFGLVFSSSSAVPSIPHLETRSQHALRVCPLCVRFSQKTFSQSPITRTQTAPPRPRTQAQSGRGQTLPTTTKAKLSW
ncbi:hypothetical protein BDR07DRAFT_1362449 [Suillus spraguei]|nr:hypothetical protein BDR07DRAFT_1362449 [Suillus spraguei]